MEYFIGYSNLCFFFLIYYYPLNGSVFQICDFFSLSYIKVFMLEKTLLSFFLLEHSAKCCEPVGMNTIWSLCLRNSQSSQRNKYGPHLW